MDKLDIRKSMTEEEIDDVVNKALDMMTLKEKVASMSGNNFFLLLLKDRKFGVRAYPGGGVKRVALKPNETKSVSIDVKKKDLAWFNPDNRVWEVESIDYTIYIGSSSNNEDLLRTQISL